MRGWVGGWASAIAFRAVNWAVSGGSCATYISRPLVGVEKLYIPQEVKLSRHRRHWYRRSFSCYI